MPYIPQVRAFHEAFGIDAPSRPGLPGTLGPKCRTIRLQLPVEEFGELAMAHAAGDLVGCLDGLADIEYVLCGTLVAAAADRSGQGALIPDYEQASSGPPRMPGADLFLQLSADFLAVIGGHASALAGGDWQSIAGSALLARARLACLWAAFRVPEGLRQALFDEVHRSNMTKLGADGKPVVNEAGRVVKGPSYEPPKLAIVLAQHFPSTPVSELAQ